MAEMNTPTLASEDSILPSFTVKTGSPLGVMRKTLWIMIIRLDSIESTLSLINSRFFRFSLLDDWFRFADLEVSVNEEYALMTIRARRGD